MNTAPIPPHLLEPELFATRYSVDDVTDCWNWTGSLNSTGYGRVVANGRQYFAHRISCLIAGRGPIDGLVTDHLCRNTRCVQP